VGDRLLVRIPQHAGAPSAGTAGVNTVKVDERHRLDRIVSVRDAGPKRPGHERQMRVGVLRLFRFLGVGQLGAPVDLVVLVSRPFREHGPEDVDVGHHPAAAVVQSRGETLIEVASGGMERTAERLGIGIQGVAELLRHNAANVDDVHPRAGRELERELDRR